jgi:hypothetical protein
MKLTFFVTTLFARCFRSATLAGPVELKVFRPERTAIYVAGAAAGRLYNSGAIIGQHFHTGATTGISHG